MLEIFGLVIALTALGTLARGRGASPVGAGSVALGGWLVFGVVLRLFTRNQDVNLALAVAGWAWIGAVALLVRFAIGRGHPQPDSKWSCSNCHYLNNASAVVCEACQQPWRT